MEDEDADDDELSNLEIRSFPSNSGARGAPSQYLDPTIDTPVAQCWYHVIKYNWLLA